MLKRKGGRSKRVTGRDEDLKRPWVVRALLLASLLAAALVSWHFASQGDWPRFAAAFAGTIVIALAARAAHLAVKEQPQRKKKLQKRPATRPNSLASGVANTSTGEAGAGMSRTARARKAGTEQDAEVVPTAAKRPRRAKAVDRA